MEKSNRNEKCYSSRKPIKCDKVVSTDSRISGLLPKTLVLPVSGHGLVEQLGLLLWFLSRGYKPKTVLGASGGAIVGCVGIVFDWNYDKIVAWISSIPNFEPFKHHSLFYVEGLLCRNSLFNLGPGLDYIFNFVTQPKFENKLRNSELIILTKNETKGRAEIFSTVSNRNSLLKDSSGPLDLFGAKCDVEFLGEVKSEKYLPLTKSVLKATSAVPVVFPPVTIGNSKYSDGGGVFSSPLNPVMSMKRLEEIVYIFPEDIEQENPSDCSSTMEIAQHFLSSISRAHYIHDRSSYLQGLCAGKFENLKKITGDANELYDALVKTTDKRRMIEIFPCVSRNLPIMSSHDKKDIISRAREQLDNLRFRLFYV